MHPHLFDFGDVDLPLIGEVHLALPTYGLLFAASAVIAWWWFARRARKLGLDENAVYNLAFYTLVAGLLGAKATLLVVEWRYYLSNPGEILGIVRSAGVLMGGVVAGGLTFVLYARRRRLPLAPLSDAVVAPLAIAQAVGRLGCFAAGCCYGTRVAADSPWAIVFTSPEASRQTGVPLHVPLFPVQLVQMAADLALAGVLTLMWRARVGPPGTVTFAYLALYGVSRFVIEFWRGDTSRGVYFGGTLSTSQILALVAIAIGVGGISIARHRSGGSPEPRRDGRGK